MKLIPAWQIAVDHEWNARKHYDRIEPLAEDLKEPADQRVPFEVRPVGPPFERYAEPDRYFLLSGHRRMKALELNLGKDLAKEELSCIVQHPKSAAEARIINLRENTQHRQLRNCDLARSFSELGKAGMTDEAIAKACFQPVSTVSKLHYVWDNLIREAREFWEESALIKEPSIAMLYSIAQKDVLAQRRWLTRQTGSMIPAEAIRQIVKKDGQKSLWIRPRLIEIKKLVRDFKWVQQRQRRGLSEYELAYLDALEWVVGKIGKAYDPYSKKGPRS